MASLKRSKTSRKVVSMNGYLLLNIRIRDIRIRIIGYSDGVYLVVVDLISNGHEIGRQEYADPSVAMSAVTDTLQWSRDIARKTGRKAEHEWVLTVAHPIARYTYPNNRIRGWRVFGSH